MKNKVFFSYAFRDQNIVEYHYSLLSKYIAKDNEIFFYDRVHHKKEWDKVLKEEIPKTEVFVFFLGAEIGSTQKEELALWKQIKSTKNHLQSILVEIINPSRIKTEIPTGFNHIVRYLEEDGGLNLYNSFCKLYSKLVGEDFSDHDGLPADSQIFNYEKHIINFYTNKYIIDKKIKENTDLDDIPKINEILSDIKKKLKQGIPPTWPEVKINTKIEIDGQVNKDRYKIVKNPLLKEIGDARPVKDRVMAAALTKYHEYDLKVDDERSKIRCIDFCMKENYMTFPEAGPRERIYVPDYIGFERHYNVAILVTGGIAPGINALIDSITRRHYKYARASGYVDKLQVIGLRNGFQSFDNEGDKFYLFPDKEAMQSGPKSINTSEIISLGGSKIGTSRVGELEVEGEDRIRKLKDILSLLKAQNINILYIIGGEGSMKAAHALNYIYEKEYPEEKDWRFNVVGIPKTMDNDILWVWQTFGFMSAVEKAREFIDYLAVEVSSNPRLGIVQLFGSNSGFVVSHAVLASRTGICDFALIPESPFSIKILLSELEKTIDVKNHGLLIMSETAIPVDALEYLDKYSDEIQLNSKEKHAIEKYFKVDKQNIKGHIDDKLRDASFKIVRVAIEKEINFRVLTNEPRHLIRAIPPSTVDIINASRLGILAVDNALAGYTDFMISQWLTEYCLIPLDLVVLGRKRIPKDGIFWKSVITKTGQEEKLV